MNRSLSAGLKYSFFRGRAMVADMLSTLSLSDTFSNGTEHKPSNDSNPRDVIVQKPPSDDAEYRVLTLKNGLRCLLISDENITKSETSAFRAHKEITSTEKAAACLSVQVGSSQNPKEIPGLAHFLEHMLFMGCRKYPNENEYDEYLDKYGGTSNAHTDFEVTSYTFDVSADHLEGALDRFAHQFIEPLLKKSSMGREAKAVDSEYMMGLQSDADRLQAICVSLLQDDHPYNIFDGGNKQSLMETPRKKHNLDTHAELRKFYNTYYSANIMCLCVEGPIPLDELEKMIQVFEEVPNKHMAVPKLDKYPLPQPRCNFIKYNPVKDRKKLIVDWFLPPQLQFYLSKPEEYVEWCVAHEGEGSLLASLKHQGLATSLEAGVGAGGFESGSNFSRFSIEIGLSEKGLTEYKHVIHLIFQYLAVLKQQLPLQRIYDEVKKMNQIDFDYMENENPYDKVEDLSDNMTLYPEEHYLSGPELLFEYKPALILEVLNALTPDRMLVVLQSKTFAEECRSVERWYSGPYNEGNFETEFIDMLSNATPGDFYLPEPNPYIPEDFEIKDIDVEGPTPAPVVISDDSRYKIWYHKDDVFQQPECIMYWHIFSKRLGENISSYAINSLYAELCSSRTTDIFYPAELAGLGASTQIGREGWVLKFEGYNDKMPNFYKAFCDEFIDSSKNVFNFHAVKDSMTKGVRMATLKPKSFANEIRQKLMRQTYYSSEEFADALEAVTVDDIQGHKIRDMGGFYLEALCGGNITSVEVETYLAHLKEGLELEGNQMGREEIRQTRVYKMPEGRWVYRARNKNSDDVNTVVVNYYQHDVLSFKDTVILRVIESLMSEPMFNQLRTRLQLGYNVSVSDHETYGVTGFSLTVCTQASKFTAHSTNAYMEHFLVWFKEYLNAMEEDAFDKRISEMIKERLIPHINIDDEMEQMWNEISVQEYIFDRDERVAEELKKLTKGEIISFYYNLFLRNVRKLSVQVEGNPDGTSCSVEEEGEESEDESEEGSDEESEDGEEDDVTIPNMKLLAKDVLDSWSEECTEIKSVEEFHAKCKLLPVYKLATKVVTLDVTNKL